MWRYVMDGQAVENWPLGRRGWPIARGVHQPPSRSTLRPRGPAHGTNGVIVPAAMSQQWPEAWLASCPRAGEWSLAVAAACSMTAETCLGWDIITTCDDRCSSACEEAPSERCVAPFRSGRVLRDGLVRQIFRAGLGSGLDETADHARVTMRQVLDRGSVAFADPPKIAAFDPTRSEHFRRSARPDRRIMSAQERGGLGAATSRYLSLPSAPSRWTRNAPDRLERRGAGLSPNAREYRPGHRPNVPVEDAPRRVRYRASSNATRAPPGGPVADGARCRTASCGCRSRTRSASSENDLRRRSKRPRGGVLH